VVDVGDNRHVAKVHCNVLKNSAAPLAEMLRCGNRIHCASHCPPKRFDAGRRLAMPRGDKGAYSSKQKRKAEHIAEGYEDRGVSSKEAKSRAWATVNKESGGGERSGSGRGKSESHASSRKGGRKGGSTSSSRSAAAKKGWETRRRRGHS
jgi:plasmid stabilization system protein ParE